MEPVLPGHWNGFTARLKHDGAQFHIVAARDASGEIAVTVNGRGPGKNGGFALDGDASVEHEASGKVGAVAKRGAGAAVAGKAALDKPL